MHGNTGNILLGFLISGVSLAAYFTPAIIAMLRRVPNIGSVIVVDLLLGWTVIGWIVALAMACRSKPPQLQYQQPRPVPWQPRS